MPTFLFVLRKYLFLSICTFCISIAVHSQPSQRPDTVLALDQCVAFALKHQPFINQALLNQAIVKATNAINTAGWLPQVNVAGNLTHYNSLPTSFINNNGTVVTQRTGVVNTFTPTLSVTQTIFNPALLYAVQAAPDYNKQAEQITDSTKIEIIAAVSKTFYSLLLTLEQINVLKQDTARLNKNVSDTYYQYKGGIVDETDYDEAVISLNNY